MKRLKVTMLSTALLSFMVLKGYTQQVEDILPRWKYINDSKVSLYNHFTGQAFKMLDERKQLLSKLNSKQDWLKRQEQVRKTYGKILGTFPKRAPLNPVITGVLERDGIRMEKIYFESLPGYYVTGALFLPLNKKGKLPAIVYCSGHSKSGFRSRPYQHMILNLVKKGFAVFAFDPIGQGERRQYLTDELHKNFGPTQEHSYPGSQLFLTGMSPAYYFIWDGMRAIDYLYSRPEIDIARIGVTGRSGGGTQSAYIAAFDSRVKAAAPECYITSYEKLLMTMGPQDAEQNFAKSIYSGLDIADLLICHAPKPMLIVSTTRDIFSIQGTRDVFKEVKQAYSYLGNSGDLNMVEDDAAHASTLKNREATYRFFQKYLSNPGNPVDENVPIFNEDELTITKGGNVYASLKGENLHTLAKKHLTEVLSRRTKITGFEDLKKRITAVTGFSNKSVATSPIFSDRYQRKNYSVEAYLLKAPTVYLPVYWLKPKAEKVNKKTILLLDDRGKSEAIKEGGLADSFAIEGYQVVVPDLSGFGELANGMIKGGDSYVDKIPLNLWYAGILVNESLLSVRLKEISLLLDWIKKSNREIEGIATGILTTDLLHIAILRNGSMNSLLLIDPLISFQSVVEEPDFQTKYLLSSVSEMVNHYDLYDLINYLSDKIKIQLINPRNGAGEIIGRAKGTPLNKYGITKKQLLHIKYEDSSFEELFDGVSLKGWKCDTALWHVKDKMIVGEIKPGKELKENSFIIWQGGLTRDFELVAEYRISDAGNSGFNYRSETVPGKPYRLRGYQADIDGANKYTGQNYEELGRKILAFPGQKVRLPPVEGSVSDYAKKNVWTASQQLESLGNLDSLKSFIKNNDWNVLRIIAKGNRLLHYINGVLISDVTDDDVQNRRMDGLLGFQVHVGPPMTIGVRRIGLKRL